jgi:mono/diheme cytochrome c family protein
MKGKQRSNRGQRLLIVALAWGLPTVARADPVDFSRDVWTIFQERCIRCHGPAKQKSSLRLDSRAALLKGGDNGPAVVVGEPGRATCWS